MTNTNIVKTLGLIGLFTLTACATNTQAKSLSPQAKDAVLAALDDEYKAQSLYKVILTKHGDVRPFSNIINAEKRHSDMLIKLLKTYGQAVPENPYENGAKPKLIAPATLLEACQISVAAEIENVALYDDQLLSATSNYSDITDVMTRLRNASEERHLPAFQRCVSRGGTMGQGKGKGHGQGRGQY
ncbi:MAG: DUF2202 domain-containing protein [Robiginitomaculum sp.]|nr:DUF2202 domain-containing protein [Robiginitomaculum sp.]PHS38856.1 MAG: DUF2202 domain-containing protein [Robiginitomaculum sp.]